MNQTYRLIRPLLRCLARPMKVEWKMRPYLGVLPRVFSARNSAFSAPKICTVDDCGGAADHMAQLSFTFRFFRAEHDQHGRGAGGVGPVANERGSTYTAVSG